MAGRGFYVIAHPIVHAAAAIFAAFATAQAGDFTLLYTGASRGIGSGRYEFTLPQKIADALSADQARLLRATPYHGAIAQDSFILVAADRRVQTLLDFLAEGGIECADSRTVLSLRTGRERLLIQEEGLLPHWVTSIRGRPARSTWGVRRCKSNKGTEAELYAPFRFMGATQPEWKLERFEVRLALRLDIEDRHGARTLELIGIPAEDAARRFRRMATLRAKKQTIFVDAGSFVDGSSTVREGKLSLHRPLGFDMLSRLRPTALVPGQNELVAGARIFLEEAKNHKLPYLATNWAPKDPELELPEYIIAEIQTSSVTARVAFLGALDPNLVETAPKLTIEDVTIEDPVAAINRVVSTLESLEPPPDMVVVLTIAGDDVRRALEANLRGVDLLIGEPDRPNTRARRHELQITPATENDPPVAALPIFGISTAEITLRVREDRFELAKVAIAPHRISERTQPDQRVAAAVTKTRANVYPPIDRPLLAAPSGGPLDTIGDDEWRHMVCEAVRQTTNADVVLLAPLPKIPRFPGPQTELLVADRLGLLDRLEVHTVPGSLLTDLLREARGRVPTACGGQIGVRVPLVRGRLIDPDSLYSVVTTDRARVLSLQPLFTAAETHRLLDRTGPEPVLDAHGDPLTLRAAVILALKELAANASGREAPLEAFDFPSALDKSPLWQFRVTRLSARVEKFEDIDNANFASVPETLASAKSSLAIGADADISFVYDTPKLLADARARSTYFRIKLEDKSAEELADDLKLSSSAAIPWIAQTIGPFKVMPFGEVLLDTEFTFEEPRTQRQKDLFFTGGAAITAEPILRSFRAGAFALRDLSRPERPTEYGARATGDTLLIIGPELRFTTLLDATYWANTGEDDASDLRYRITAEARLALPLARWLDIGFFGRIFAIRGRVPATDESAAAFTAGFSADLRGAFKL